MTPTTDHRPGTTDHLPKKITDHRPPTNGCEKTDHRPEQQPTTDQITVVKPPTTDQIANMFYLLRDFSAIAILWYRSRMCTKFGQAHLNDERKNTFIDFSFCMEFPDLI